MKRRSPRLFPNKIPPLAYLETILSYDPETGIFRWKNLTGSSASRFSGKVAGTIDNGYIRIMIGGVKYLAHRLAWVFLHGDQKRKFEPDHRDRNGLNNAEANLRLATHSQQGCNRRQFPSKSGIKGVYFKKGHKSRPWQAHARFKGKNIHLGYYSTSEAAFLTVELFRKANHGEFFSPTQERLTG